MSAEAHAQLEEKDMMDSKIMGRSKDIARCPRHTKLKHHRRKEAAKQVSGAAP